MQRHAEAAGLGDVVIVNTCAVTAEATRQARQTIRRLAREKPGRPHRRHRLRRAGRAATLRRHAGGRAGHRQRREDEGRDLDRRSRISASATEKVRVNDIMAVRETAAASGRRHARAHARAFVQVQNGCDHRCTFCIIPFGRGNSRSVPDGRGRRAGAHPRGARLPRGRADRRRHHQLRPGPAGRADARHAGEEHPAPRAGARAPAPLLDRFGRGRRRPARRARDRGAG